MSFVKQEIYHTLAVIRLLPEARSEAETAASMRYFGKMEIGRRYKILSRKPNYYG